MSPKPLPSKRAVAATAANAARSRHRGFTIVELMLAVAVVGILATLVISHYSSYRERARQTQAKQDIAILQGLIKAFEADNLALPPSLAVVGNAGRLDPWGHPYVYLDLTPPGARGAARKDRRLSPINTDFDLYSVGSDGLTHKQLTHRDSQDDIVRARDGGFIGVAADFAQ